ncbi:kinase-like domain-containing protein, partial [Suillus cothurnatus]
ELKVWLRLSKHPTIVPLLGIAHVGSLFPALVSQWMPSGTLYMYLEQGKISASAKIELASPLFTNHILHSEKVVHGDLQPANVLIDDSGNPRLTGFNLATVVGDPELQLTMTTADHSFDVRWRAPELIGVDCDPGMPTFESDIYSFGSVTFFVLTLVIPWHDVDEYKVVQKLLGGEEILRPETSAATSDVTDARWNQIEQCWSSDASARPSASMVMNFLKNELDALTDGVCS